MIFSKRRIADSLCSLYVTMIASVTHAPKAWKLLTPALKLWGINYGDCIWLSSNTSILNAGSINFASRIAMGENTRLRSYKCVSINIGDDFLSAPGLTIDCAVHDPATLEPHSASIIIGERVWCGLNVTICGGVVIGDDVVIGAGSVVTKSIPPNVVAVGVPCRVLKSIDRSNSTKIWSAWRKNENRNSHTKS
ncbi:MAG: hypothetical protein CFE44_25490 [Burkholderiales bacterium PBB4]|nr:MAG: hypothetical protein CFE44_25490 [Burkholderiales bacterium PBB4]